MSLFIYHPQSRTVIPLTDEVYLCDTDDIEHRALAAMHTGIGLPISIHRGIPLDTHNMSRAFTCTQETS